MARHLFGTNNEQVGGEFLLDWITCAPLFGRDTTDYMIDRAFKAERLEHWREGHLRRKKLLDAIVIEAADGDFAKHLAYWKGLEDFNMKFMVDETLLQQAVDALNKGDFESAISLLEKTDPESTLKRYTEYAAHLGIIPGDLGLTVLMDLKWYPSFVGARQLAGMEPYRIKFAPTEHEPLAQGAGSRSFHIDMEKNLWLARGARETGGEQWARPIKAGGFSETEMELVQSGVSWSKPVALPILPAMNHYFLSKGRSGAPLKGAGKLTVFAAAPEEASRFEISLRPTVKPTNSYQCDPARAQFLRIRCRGNTLNGWNSICEIETPSRKKDGVVLASRELPDFQASAAVDGNSRTRWAVEGKSEWIQLELDPEIPFEKVRIEWFGNDDREYLFDLELSTDGKQWKAVDFKAVFPTPNVLRLGTIEVPSGTAAKFEYPIPNGFPLPGILSIEPKSEKASLCGIVLEQ